MLRQRMRKYAFTFKSIKKVCFYFQKNFDLSEHERNARKALSVSLFMVGPSWEPRQRLILLKHEVH